MTENATFKASFISTISKFSGERSGRIGINIPANLKRSFPVGIKVKVYIEEVKEGVEGSSIPVMQSDTDAGIKIV